MTKYPSKLKVLDLFSGIGGFSLGLERTGGFETVAFCEVCPKARQVLRKHWQDIPIYEDVRTLTNEQLRAGNLVPDVICGGFPCQDISCAGKGRGINAERSGLWAQMFRLIGDVLPTWAIIENVSALRSKGLTLVLQNLCQIGYVCEWHCIPASAIGAPHQRDRVWIIAYRNANGSNEQKIGEFQGGKNTKSSRVCRDVPDTMRQHQTKRGIGTPFTSNGGIGQTEQGRSHSDVERERPIRSAGSSTKEDVAHTMRKKRPARWKQFIARHHVSLQARKSKIWQAEPNVGRVADGIPKRVDRLKQLGNSVVPQIPELIGNAILEANNV